jgi:thiamine-phosphate pyrophosphorylase
MKASERLEVLDRARLYLVAPGEFPVDVLESVVEAGVDVVQLRMKDADAVEIIEIGDHMQQVCESLGVLFVVNDRPDLALALSADGVHLGQDDLPPTVARDMLGPDVLIGRSTHSPADIDRALEEHEAGRADYIAVGPVYRTPTHPERPAVGLELVSEAAGRVGFPWFAIGGIDPSNTADVAGAGAARIAVVRAITLAADPVAAVDALRAALG